MFGQPLTMLTSSTGSAKAPRIGQQTTLGPTSNMTLLTNHDNWKWNGSRNTKRTSYYKRPTKYEHHVTTYPVSGTHLNNGGGCLGREEAAIPAEGQGTAGQRGPHRRQRALHKVLRVVLLHKHFGGLPEPAGPRLLAIEGLCCYFD